jgi:hypothetical protein
MKQFIFTILIILLSGCNGGKNDKSPNISSVKETARKEKPVINNRVERPDSLKDPYSRYYLSDKNLKEIGDLILKDSVIPTDNYLTFRIMDSLSARTYQDRKFYFKVYAKILNKADGALAEAMGIPGLKYVESHTREFIGLSIDLTNKQIESWANFIAWEIIFDSRKDPIEDGNMFIEKLISNCGELDLKLKRELDNFNKLIMNAIKENKKNKE